MFKHNVLRVTAAMTIFVVTIVGGTVQALANQPPGESLGRSGLLPQSPVAASTGLDVSGTPAHWVLVVLVAVAVVAAAGVISSLARQRSHTHQPA